jgi:hypothetical protein
MKSIKSSLKFTDSNKIPSYRDEKDSVKEKISSDEYYKKFDLTYHKKI